MRKLLPVYMIALCLLYMTVGMLKSWYFSLLSKTVNTLNKVLVIAKNIRFSLKKSTHTSVPKLADMYFGLRENI